MRHKKSLVIVADLAEYRLFFSENMLPNFGSAAKIFKQASGFPAVPTRQNA
jgi:hypothetical protein